jgi:predicted pyridoxine 5'-phosphate oxidase superfamily flavin-nucleotide-binding protein
MPHAYTKIMFTDGVKAAQTRYGTRENNEGFEEGPEIRRLLTQREAEFIESRDSFYQATVNEDGWPYMQHRGGPAGFLKVLSPTELGYADFRGNLQYISIGNLSTNDRVSIFFMDYANKRRLKLLGRARIDNNPELLKRLVVPEYKAKVERGMIIQVEAYDWNCPQHITPRYSIEELRPKIEALVEENRRLKQLLEQQDK